MNLKNIETYRLAGYQEKTVTATVNTFALALIEQFITIDATIGTATITLPPVVEACGRFYSFRKSDSSANVVTVVGAGDEIAAFSNASLDGLDATLLVFSDGTQWFEFPALGRMAVLDVVNVATSMLANQLIVKVANTAAVTITLPGVAAAKGRTYSITKTTADAHTVTVVGAGDEAVTFSNISLEDEDQTLIVFSDGTQWFEILALAPPAVLAITATATLTANQQVVTIANTAAATVTLPPVAAAKGRRYTIHKISADAEAVTVASADGDVAYSNATLDAENDRVVVFSDGRQWYEIGAVIA